MSSFCVLQHLIVVILICNFCFWSDMTLYFFVTASVSLDVDDLRRQQLRLCLIKACRVLFGRQEKLRLILMQSMAHEVPTAPDPDLSGSDDELGDGNEVPSTILQQLMLSATQPSPLKAVFTREELEVSRTRVCVTVVTM